MFPLGLYIILYKQIEFLGTCNFMINPQGKQYTQYYRYTPDNKAKNPSQWLCDHAPDSRILLIHRGLTYLSFLSSSLLAFLPLLCFSLDVIFRT